MTRADLLEKRRGKSAEVQKDTKGNDGKPKLSREEALAKARAAAALNRAEKAKK